MDKPPAALLAEVVSLFKAAPRVERLANVLFRDGSFGVHWPDQEGTPVSVEAPGMVETDEAFTVVQLHSHGHLPAFFSEQDDEDEARTGLFGVVGRCHEPVPEMVFRFSVNGLLGFASANEIFAEAYSGELDRIANDLRPDPVANRKAGTRWARARP